MLCNQNKPIQDCPQFFFIFYFLQKLTKVLYLAHAISWITDLKWKKVQLKANSTTPPQIQITEYSFAAFFTKKKNNKSHHTERKTRQITKKKWPKYTKEIRKSNADIYLSHFPLASMVSEYVSNVSFLQKAENLRAPLYLYDSAYLPKPKKKCHCNYWKLLSRVSDRDALNAHMPKNSLFY